MNATLTIIRYLYEGCNTWLTHGEGCLCTTDEKVAGALNEIPVEYWLDVDKLGKGLCEPLLKPQKEWDELCGPTAEKKAINGLVELYMSKAAELVSLQATKERQSGE